MRLKKRGFPQMLPRGSDNTRLTLECLLQSYIVRWVKVDEGHTISWSVQPHKKSM